MNADAFRPKLRGDVSDRSLQRGFDGTHEIVVFDDLFRTVEGDREQASASRHEGLGQARHANERMARNVHGEREAGLRAIGDPAVQILLRREGDRMQQKIEPAPPLADPREPRLKLPWFAHVASDDDRALEFFGQWADVRLRLRIEIGDGEVCAGIAQRLRTAIGDAVLVGDTGDEPFFAMERHALPDFRFIAHFSTLAQVGCFSARRRIFPAHLRAAGSLCRERRVPEAVCGPATAGQARSARPATKTPLRSWSGRTTSWGPHRGHRAPDAKSGNAVPYGRAR